MSGHVFLIGFMGAGKSTVGRLLADRLGRPCIDLDSRIERQCGVSVAEIFAASGEDAFRDAETAALAATEAEPDSVIACGGGIVLRPENRVLLRQLGSVVYLEVSPAEALARVGDVATRPLLAGGGARVAESLLDARINLYRSVADIVVDTVGSKPDEVAEAAFAGLSTKGLT